ncbi:MAG TPA: hypothetical protein PLU22_08770 [Polyangiaceae bacterium]|nr:hypothetical protein [Polyangiaceae bacterium]
MPGAPVSLTARAPDPASFARGLALVSLAARRGAESGWVRAARWLTPMVGGGVAALMVTLHLGTSAPSTDPLLEQALLIFTWVGGGLAMIGVTRDAALDDAKDGVTTLAHQRGHDGTALARARWLGSAWVVAATLAPTALAVTALEIALARTLTDLRVGLALAAAAVVYLAVASAVLVLLGRAAVALWPCRPRLALAGLVLAPELLRAAGVGVPSVPAALAALLARAFAIGTGVA